MPKGRPDKGYALTPQREKVLRILAEAGGSLDDESGLVVSKLREQTGHESTQALSMVIKQLEQSGLVKRDVTGRRTYHLELVTDALAPEDAARLGVSAPRRTVAHELEGDVAGATTDGTDYRRLADELLKAALAAVAKKGAADPKVKMALLETQGRLEEERARSADLADQLIERGEEILRLKEQLRIAEHNLAVVQKQREKQRAERGSDRIEERLTERERQELEGLKRLMETRPGSA